MSTPIKTGPWWTTDPCIRNSSEADKLLIAAAPDLLEVAKIIAPHIPAIVAMGWLEAEQADRIRAAIAKATGAAA